MLNKKRDAMNAWSMAGETYAFNDFNAQQYAIENLCVTKCSIIIISSSHCCCNINIHSVHAYKWNQKILSIIISYYRKLSWPLWIYRDQSSSTSEDMLSRPFSKVEFRILPVVIMSRWLITDFYSENISNWSLYLESCQLHKHWF